MKAIEAFRAAMFRISSLSSRIFAKKPGAVIDRMSEKEREALKELKSSQIDGSERLDDLEYVLGSEEYYENKKFIQEKLEFDKKIMK